MYDTVIRKVVAPPTENTWDRRSCINYYRAPLLYYYINKTWYRYISSWFLIRTYNKIRTVALTQFCLSIAVCADKSFHILLFLSGTDLLALSFIIYNNESGRQNVCEKRVVIKNHRKHEPTTTYCLTCHEFVYREPSPHNTLCEKKSTTHQVFDSTRVFARKRQIFNRIFDHLQTKK